MIPQRYDLTIYQGSDLIRYFALRTTTGTVLNLATVGDGYTIGRMTIRESLGGTEVLPLTTTNGRIDLTYQADSNGTYWSGRIVVDAATTAGIEDFGDGIYDLEISDGLHVFRILEGVARVSPESTS